MSEEAQVVKPLVSPIATPLSNEKLTGRVLKMVRKAAKAKRARRGVKEVVKALRKKEKGIMILSGNVTPIDVISHIPILCEEANIPYVFVPAKEELGRSFMALSAHVYVYLLFSYTIILFL
jgi:H/ACA ribonucleoprotein complex subunit 2